MLASVLLAGCAKQVPLPDITVSAASASEFTRFRADLGTRFTPEQLKDFDTATQELQLDAMNRDLPSVAAREADMQRAANGRTVHAVTLLGWKARRARFLRETDMMQRMLARDLEEQARTAATGTPAGLTRRIGSEREVLAKLQTSLAETERHLVELQSHTK